MAKTNIDTSLPLLVAEDISEMYRGTAKESTPNAAPTTIWAIINNRIS